MKLSLFSYNINAHLFKSQSQLKKLLYHIFAHEYDIVCLQGLYTSSVQRKFKNALFKEYKTIVHHLNSQSFPHKFFFDSGLFLSSKLGTLNLSKLETAKKNPDGHLFVPLKTDLFSLKNKSVSFNILKISDNDRVLIINSEAISEEQNLNSFRTATKALVDELIKKNMIEAQNFGIIYAQSSKNNPSFCVSKNDIDELFNGVLNPLTFKVPTVLEQNTFHFNPKSPYIATELIIPF